MRVVYAAYDVRDDDQRERRSRCAKRHARISEADDPAVRTELQTFRTQLRRAYKVVDRRLERDRAVRERKAVTRTLARNLSLRIRWTAREKGRGANDFFSG